VRGTNRLIARKGSRLLALAAGLSLGTMGCGEKQEQPPEIVRPVKSLVVAPAAEGVKRSFSGVARPGREATLAFRVGGKIREILVEAGDEVGEGTVLARLDDTDYRLDVRNLEHNLESAGAAARNSENSYRRAMGLYENNNISRDTLDQAEAQRNSDRAQTQALEAQLEQARNQLSYAELRAPFAGSVSGKEVEEYETVTAGQPVLRILDPRSIKIRLGVPESLAARIEPGRRAEVALESFPGKTFRGSVSEVEIALDNMTGTYPVTVVLLDPPAGARPGMAAEVSFFFEFPEGEGIVVPTSAVFSDLETGADYVWVVEGGKVNKRRVALGTLCTEGVEVTSGLEGGERVVTAGVSRLEEGRRVRLGDGLEP